MALGGSLAGCLWAGKLEELPPSLMPVRFGACQGVAACLPSACLPLIFADTVVNRHSTLSVLKQCKSAAQLLLVVVTLTFARYESVRAVHILAAAFNVDQGISAGRLS